MPAPCPGFLPSGQRAQGSALASSSAHWALYWRYMANISQLLRFLPSDSDCACSWESFVCDAELSHSELHWAGGRHSMNETTLNTSVRSSSGLGEKFLSQRQVPVSAPSPVHSWVRTREKAFIGYLKPSAWFRFIRLQHQKSHEWLKSTCPSRDYYRGWHHSLPQQSGKSWISS